MTELSQSYRELIESYIGSACFICGSDKGIHFHQRYGKNHPNNYEYILKNYVDFIPLCKYCHRQLHGLAKLLRKASQDKILELAWDINTEPQPQISSELLLAKLSKKMQVEVQNLIKPHEDSIPSVPLNP